MFRKRKNSSELRALPRVALCCADSAMSRDAADWLDGFGICKTSAILSDEPADVLWACLRERVDILLLEALPDAMERLDDPDRDITGRCRLSAQLKEQLPACRVYLLCSEEFLHMEPTLKKAEETGLIDGYHLGGLTLQCAEQWLAQL